MAITVNIKEWPSWRRNCFMPGTALLCFGMMTNFVTEQIHPGRPYTFLGPLLLIGGTVLCLFGKGWIRVMSVLAGLLLASIALLSA